MAQTGGKPATEEGVIERTALIMHGLCNELQQSLQRSATEADDIDLGMLMGLTMYLDARLGPFRTDRLMTAAPQIILRTDAHVTPTQDAAIRSTLRRLGRVLATLP
ncbi:hypothetical protein GE253_13195 [Niveispirillum sp. SYP-B3756]|uniref:hypothetical protein n=1 Tax=Niveispirillum sp. SYP-B3756 TaxID=2662178 RepID=UPI0012913413|nr:hypothetical protein [Niveispirillum sp. SYP-B3756]MQP66296.1 hypothetical protein [Niveispirillum sp. SYP-B3756]